MTERRPIPGFEGFYEADRDGNIYSVSRLIKRLTSGLPLTGRMLKPKLNPQGYHSVRLTVDSVGKTHLVHRLVLKAFSEMPPAPNNFVNHKNGVRNDNRVENLEWCSKSGNALHAYRILGSRRAVVATGDESPHAKGVTAFDPSTGTSRTFGSITSAAAEGFKVAGISSCANGHQKTHRGLIWQFT